ncbi:class I histocompatibility antigen, F10 alpha chain-like [Megalops cyprinoides]|uniref:class I histocompatibility antigen, F10 alpha chain-like n=1 Tax=Megalops cyprinoides TaxID=118141 RepID=UPI001864930B|nr:class I histocompatibility antigen, F10 alpha chain-like [Megalops cyprinoides]
MTVIYDAIHSMRGYFVGSKGLELPEYYEVIMVDEVPVFYYDSTMTAEAPIPDWLNFPEGRLHWNDINSIAIHNKHSMAVALQVTIQHVNQTGDFPSKVHIYQGHGICDLHPDGTIQSFVTHAYNGKDFLSFDMETKTWTAVVPQAVYYKRKRESASRSERIAEFYKHQCVERMKIFLKNAPALLVDNHKAPEVSLFEKRGSTSSDVTVTCHVTGFYPPTVQVEWLGAGVRPLVEGVNSEEVLPNGDGTFQMRKTLTISAAAQNTQSYRCLVLHSSVPSNITRHWVPGEDPPTAVIVGTIIVVTCLVVAVGLAIYCYKRRTASCQHTGSTYKAAATQTEDNGETDPPRGLFSSLQDVLDGSSVLQSFNTKEFESLL